MKDKININDLYFGVVIPTEVEGKVKYQTQNLFGSVRVKTSVARWATMKPERGMGLCAIICYAVLYVFNAINISILLYNLWS